MSISTKIAGYLATIGMLLVTAIASSSAFAGVLIPDIADPGYPRFTNTVKVQTTPAGKFRAKLTNATRDFKFWTDGGTSYAGLAETFRLDANFDKHTGEFLGGDMMIEGTLPGLGITTDTILMTADLTLFGTDGGSWVGFNTTNIMCSPLLGVVCTDNESVVFYLDSVFEGVLTSARYSATAITTVPLPAAVWLFGSGLCLIGATARRRKASL